MKRLSLIIGKIGVIGLLVMLPTMMCAVEYKNTYQPAGGRNQYGTQFQATAPSATFKSTSTLAGSGSAFSATPMLGEDGTAAYEGANYSPAKAPSGPHRDISNPTKPTPIGDAVLPLMLMVGAFAIWRAARRRVSKGEA